MVSQPQNPNSSHPRPLFGAELEARTPDGNPVFEMSGESAPSKDDNSTSNIYPERNETGPNSQAHPWPFCLDEQGQRRPIMEEAGRAQAAANENADAVPAALAIKFGRPAGSDASAEVRPLALRPVSPAETESFIPAPLNISRPSQSSPPPLSPKKYKPYQPPASLEEPKSPSIAGHPKHEPGQAYKPYRRPSYDDRQSASAAAVPTAAPASNYGVGSAPTSPAPSAQPFRYPSPSGQEQQTLAAIPTTASPEIPTASSPALGNRTPSPSLRPYQALYSEYEVGNQANQSPPPPVPLKTRPPAVDSSARQEAGAHFYGHTHRLLAQVKQQLNRHQQIYTLVEAVQDLRSPRAPFRSKWHLLFQIQPLSRLTLNLLLLLLRPLNRVLNPVPNPALNLASNQAHSFLKQHMLPEVLKMQKHLRDHQSFLSSRKSTNPFLRIHHLPICQLQHTAPVPILFRPRNLPYSHLRRKWSPICLRLISLLSLPMLLRASHHPRCLHSLSPLLTGSLPLNHRLPLAKHQRNHLQDSLFQMQPRLSRFRLLRKMIVYRRLVHRLRIRNTHTPHSQARHIMFFNLPHLSPPGLAPLMRILQ
ncbi:unnamed protein product [Clonostachys rosea]|uniref:Uncharacterized protein n=1 Tax=Bionectria ochroleuca TaxID=29856 RepID=A0ABY6USL7_BIOOC|nr:unnamed protein product [Clonostachys rosea]